MTTVHKRRLVIARPCGLDMPGVSEDKFNLKLCPRRLVVGAVVLALRIEDPLPIVCLVTPLQVCIDEYLHLVAEEVSPALECSDCLWASHEGADDASYDRRAAAPSLGHAGENIEGSAILGVDDFVAYHLPADAQGCPSWRAFVGDSKYL